MNKNQLEEEIRKIIAKSIDTPLRSKKDAEFILNCLKPNLIPSILSLFTKMQEELGKPNIK